MRAMVRSTIKPFDIMEITRVLDARCLHANARPDTNAILQALEAAFALRHFKSSHSKYPSAFFLKQNASTSMVLSRLEELLLLIADVLEQQAEYGGVTPNEFGKIDIRIRDVCFVCARQHVVFLNQMKTEKAAPQTIRRIQQARHKYNKAMIEAQKHTVKATRAVRMYTRDSRDISKADKEIARSVVLLRQVKQEARQLRVALRILPSDKQAKNEWEIEKHLDDLQRYIGRLDELRKRKR